MEGKIIGEKDKKVYKRGQSYSLLQWQNFLVPLLCGMNYNLFDTNLS